jgi:DNA-binding NarL/FixJ family response regulator
VLIADDHAATRVGIRLALEESGFVVCAEAATGPTAVAAPNLPVRDQAADVVQAPSKLAIPGPSTE